MLLSSSFASRRGNPPQHPQQRRIQYHHQNKICRAVEKVPGNSCNPPGERRGGAAKKQVGKGTQTPVHNAEDSRKNTPKPQAVNLSQAKNSKGKQGPKVEIHHRPQSDSPYGALQKYKYNYCIKRLFPKPRHILFFVLILSLPIL